MFSQTGRAELAVMELPPLAQVSLGGTVRFQRVLALKQQAGELLKGRPYVEGAVVEGRLEDEFK